MKAPVNLLAEVVWVLTKFMIIKDKYSPALGGA
jgi:hypothetical protein